MGIAEVLTIVLVLLKLTDVITWSWWLVLLPAILSFGLYVLIVVVKLIMVMVAVFVVKKRDSMR
ncbi:transmembrane Fragile-X-F protein [Lysinibacillus fusiformis]|uniref:transmembrane Fragile-X-F protein n=1 Tax=Lysinibacillus fusiformis TaxID=28031 RepID=UPI003D077889